MNTYSIGSLVKFRGREWIVLPSQDKDVYLLRPIAGGEYDTCGVYLPLEGKNLEPTSFPLPTIQDIGDFESARLLRDAARLMLRSGTCPFRSFGHLSFRSRPYQLVPLLMALRLNPVRMLLADDVGIGKTIESAIIARELLDRGEIKRIAVICPSYLCDQWQRELSNKLNINAKVITTSTLSRLERDLPRQDYSVFKYYDHIIVSVDFIKSEKRRDAFILHCPDFVIVDEAHGCAKPPGQSIAQQQRHQLIYDLAKDESRNLILVTATPHSGFGESFLSLLGLVKPEFGNIDLENLDSNRRADLARHFIQRRRADVKQWMGTETFFPERDPIEVSFALSEEYSRFFKDIYKFVRGLLYTDSTEKGYRQRVRYWAALALLRCAMSSPASAKAALIERIKGISEMEHEEEANYAPYILDKTNVDSVADEIPVHIVNEGEMSFTESEKKKLREYIKRAENLKGEHDRKIKRAEEEIRKLLKGGLKPIVYCRFIATADYVASELLERLKPEFKDLHIISATGALSEEEREIRVAELSKSKYRVLVATDCLSEGINLQNEFNSVLHYDLPWNPNRLEQREGRVDRFGQTSKIVKAILLYGADNPIDGAVLNVLLRKARKIHKDLGITVPLPVDSETVIDAVLHALFFKKEDTPQMELFEDEPQIIEINRQWDRKVDSEKKSRTLFAQHSIKPDEIAKELESTDSVLGSPHTVEHFIINALQRLGSPSNPVNGSWKVDFSNLPKQINSKITDFEFNKIVFDNPVPEDSEFISRNHILTSSLSEYLFGVALKSDGDRNIASRCGVIRSQDVMTVTTLLILRFRFLLSKEGENSQSVMEECIISGFKGIAGSEHWLSKEEAESLFEKVQPSGNLSDKEKEDWITEMLKDIGKFISHFEGVAKNRIEVIKQSHDRLRKITKSSNININALLPADILALLVIVPQPKV